MSDVEPLRFGMFVMPIHDPAKPLAQCIDEDLELREQIGQFGTLVLTAHDWDDRDRWAHSLDLFAREVVPAFNKAIRAASLAGANSGVLLD